MKNAPNYGAAKTAKGAPKDIATKDVAAKLI